MPKVAAAAAAAAGAAGPAGAAALLYGRPQRPLCQRQHG